MGWKELAYSDNERTSHSTVLERRKLNDDEWNWMQVEESALTCEILQPLDYELQAICNLHMPKVST
jgi:hypothetical protein